MSRRSSHHGHGQSTLRNATSYIFAFFLSLALLAELLLLIAYVGFFSEKGFVSALDSEYYQYTLDYINEEATYYTMPTGYDPSVIEGVFSLAEVRKDVDLSVTSAFRRNEHEPDDTGEREKLTQNVRQLYANDGREISGEDEEIIASYVDEIMSIYRKAVKMPGLDTIANYRNKLVKVTLIAAIAVGVLAILLAVSIVRSHHYVHRGLRYVAYATGGASLLSMVAPGIMLASGYYKGLGVSPKYFYHFCISVIERLLLLCLGGGAAYLLLTLLLIALVASQRKKIITSHRSSHSHANWGA